MKDVKGMPLSMNDLRVKQLNERFNLVIKQCNDRSQSETFKPMKDLKVKRVNEFER